MSINHSDQSALVVKKTNKFNFYIIFTGSMLLVAAILLAMSLQPAAALRSALTTLFAADTQKMTWYVTRAAGFITYLLFWFSTTWGLLVASKLVDKVLHRAFTFDFHEFISLLSLGFLGLHIFVLLVDRYMPYSLAQIFVPFLSPYRPVWVGIGVIALYLSLLVTVTFYIRQHIGMKVFRAIHASSLLAYIGATLHGLFSGTDSSLPAVLMLYVISFLVVVFLMTYWLIQLRIQKSQPRPIAAPNTAGLVSPPVRVSAAVQVPTRPTNGQPQVPQSL
ncbi:MAG: hypothetical protein HGA53_03225 [Anaerolineaceae bacterium]|nr:hypothetical protein [Anaerolineaceae bacterium]